MSVKVVGIGLAVLLLVGVAFVTFNFLNDEVTCDELATTTSDPETQLILLEVGGNTDEWVDSITKFTEQQLESTLPDHPETPYSVRFVTELDGKTVTPRVGCLRDSLRLTASKSDMSAFEQGTADTKDDMRGRLQTVRREQIATIVEAIRSEVRSTEFTGTDGQPKLSVLPLWQEAAAATGDVAILSPLVSTSGDCLDQREAPASTPEQLVKDCLAADAMPKLAARKVVIETYPFLNVSAGQKAAATGMIEALEDCATGGGSC